jgi:hypothetical protein
MFGTPTQMAYYFVFAYVIGGALHFLNEAHHAGK